MTRPPALCLQYTWPKLSNSCWLHTWHTGCQTPASATYLTRVVKLLPATHLAQVVKLPLVTHLAQVVKLDVELRHDLLDVLLGAVGT